jgi:hypothetical protein
LDPKLGHVTEACQVASGGAVGGAKHVWIFKQWHLSPGVDTHDPNKSTKLAQRENQTAIYRQLDQWIKSHALSTVIAEGCTGELTQGSPLKINGWNVGELKRESSGAHYDELLSSVPLKLEAKYGDAIKTLCGDDDELIRANGLAFSDARGTVGFLSRLEQYKNDPERARTYLEGVVGLYKMPADTTIPQALARLRLELGQAVMRARQAIDQRNERAVAAIQTATGPEVAVVFGGMHAAGIKKLLEKGKISCTVVEPVGYPSSGSANDEAAMLERLEQLVGT